IGRRRVSSYRQCVVESFSLAQARQPAREQSAALEELRSERGLCASGQRRLVQVEPHLVAWYLKPQPPSADSAPVARAQPPTRELAVDFPLSPSSTPETSGSSPSVGRRIRRGHLALA